MDESYIARLKEVVVAQALRIEALSRAEGQRDAIGTKLRAANGRIRDLERQAQEAPPWQADDNLTIHNHGERYWRAQADDWQARHDLIHGELAAEKVNHAAAVDKGHELLEERDALRAAYQHLWVAVLQYGPRPTGYPLTKSPVVVHNEAWPRFDKLRLDAEVDAARARQGKSREAA